MKTFKHYSLLSILLLSLLTTQAFTHGAHEEEFEPELVEAEFATIPEGQRNLGGCPKLRVAIDVEHVVGGEGTDEFKQYAVKHLIPSVANYFQAALKVRHPLTSKITSTKATLCGYNTPQAVKKGIEADILFIFSSSYAPTASWLMATTICTIATSNGIKKPQIVRIGINSHHVDIADPIENPLIHDLNINTLLHEFIHGFAMTSSLYKYFVDDHGALLTNHVQELDLNGEVRTVLDLPALSHRLRNFYGCSSLPGVVIENDGGAHLERRFYQYEVMASGGLIGSKISEISLGFLEGSGWYIPDYTYAEPYFVGAGQGCGYYYDACDPSVFQEYCEGEDKGCNSLGESGGYCKDNARTEGCRFYLSQSYFNCENPKGIYYTTLASKQVYGRGLGSKCFAGNLTSSKTAAGKLNTYCFTYKCLGSGSTTRLQVDFGDTTFECKEKGLATVDGYQGFVSCPDPREFCATIGLPSCPKACMGQGDCIEGKCQCYEGYEGLDCGFAI